jgi:3-oxoacyl-[acyl-carrier-protein] synthase II
MGWITPLGKDIETAWGNMLAGKSGVQATTVFEASTFPTNFSAEVKAFELAEFLGEDYSAHEMCSRQVGFALAAAKMAWSMSGLDNIGEDFDRSRIGVYMGSGEGPLDFGPFASLAVDAWNYEDARLDTVEWGRHAYERFSAVCEREQEPNMAACHLAVLFNVLGPSFNTLTACSASTQAVGEAVELIRGGDADAMISGGCHSMIHPFGVTGFNRLTALSTRNDTCITASRPFDMQRDGFVLGEGAGVVILESLDLARERGAPIFGEIVGYGSTADAFRITDIHEDGRGAIAAMRLAIEEAGIRPEDIDYINAHGTGTQENDRIETQAIREVFGERAGETPISSVKSMLGHLIAAAGAVELITCLLSIRDSIVPPTVNYKTPDPNCPLDYVPNEPRKTRVDRALSNSFGFGGQNDTLVVKRYEE